MSGNGPRIATALAELESETGVRIDTTAFSEDRSLSELEEGVFDTWIATATRQIREKVWPSGEADRRLRDDWKTRPSVMHEASDPLAGRHVESTAPSEAK